MRALTGLALLAAPFAVAGEFGSLIALDSGLTAQILAGCTVAFDLLLVLCGVTLAWRNPPNRKEMWGLGIGPGLAGLALISGAALLLVVDPHTAAALGLATLGRALAGIGTGTLTVYWLRANTGSVRPPAHRPKFREQARTSPTAPQLAFTGLLVCALRTDFLVSAYLLAVYLLSAWLVVALVRAPHSWLTRALDRLGRTVSRPRINPAGAQGPVKRQIVLPHPNQSNPTSETDQTNQANRGEPAKVYVASSGRVIDLAQIPSELRLLPLPGKPAQREQSDATVQTE